MKLKPIQEEFINIDHFCILYLTSFFLTRDDEKLRCGEDKA